MTKDFDKPLSTDVNAESSFKYSSSGIAVRWALLLTAPLFLIGLADFLEDPVTSLVILALVILFWFVVLYVISRLYRRLKLSARYEWAVLLLSGIVVYVTLTLWIFSIMCCAPPP